MLGAKCRVPQAWFGIDVLLGLLKGGGIAMDFAVFGVLETKNGTLLVQERGNFAKKMWKLPGGRPTEEERDYPSEWVLQREFHDEVRVIILEPQQKDFILELLKKRGEKEYKILFYRVTHYSGDPLPSNEIEKCQLFSRDEIRSMIKAGEIVPDHAQALGAYFDKAASSI